MFCLCFVCVCVAGWGGGSVLLKIGTETCIRRRETFVDSQPDRSVDGYGACLTDLGTAQGHTCRQPEVDARCCPPHQPWLEERLGGGGGAVEEGGGGVLVQPAIPPSRMINGAHWQPLPALRSMKPDCRAGRP